MKCLLLFVLLLLVCSTAQPQFNIQPPAEGYRPCPLIDGVCHVVGKTYVIFGTPQKFTQPVMFTDDFPCYDVDWKEPWPANFSGSVVDVPFAAQQYSLCWVKSGY